MGELRLAVKRKDLPEGKAMALDVEGKMIALFNINGRIFAIDDTCTHAEGPLSEGDVAGTTVTCPWHGAQFNIATGEALSEPACAGVKAYKVQIDGDDIKIEI